MVKYLVGVAAAFALLAATPASACPDCKDCPQHKTAASAQGQETKVADADKKDEKCHCTDKKSACKCGAKCNCAKAEKKDEKKDEKKS